MQTYVEKWVKITIRSHSNNRFDQELLLNANNNGWNHDAAQDILIISKYLSTNYV